MLHVFVAAVAANHPCVSSIPSSLTPSQAAPVMSNFSKGRSAGAQLWAIINRVPEIDPDDEGGVKLDKVSTVG